MQDPLKVVSECKKKSEFSSDEAQLVEFRRELPDIKFSEVFCVLDACIQIANYSIYANYVSSGQDLSESRSSALKRAG